MMLRKRILNLTASVVLLAAAFWPGTTGVKSAFAESGEERIEILSVKQGGEEVAKDAETYLIADYDAELEIKFSAKSLRAQHQYSVYCAPMYCDVDNYTPEVDEDKEFTIVGKMDVGKSNGDINIMMSGWKQSSTIGGPGSSDYFSTVLMYHITDEDFEDLGDLVATEVRQGGNALTAVCTSEYSEKCVYDVNDLQMVEMDIRTESAMDNYAYSFRLMLSSVQRSIEGNIMTYTGAELKNGVTLTLEMVPDYADEFSLSIMRVISDRNSTGMSLRREGAESWYTEFKLNCYIDESAPRFAARLMYENFPEVEIGENGQGMVSPLYHDAENPLALTITGERFDDEETYDVKITARKDEVLTGRDESIVKEISVSKTGADLNGGAKVVFEDLVLDFPTEEEYVNNSESAYYSIEVVIGAVKRELGAYYDYGTNVMSVVVLPDGTPIVSEGGGGAGGPRISMTSSTVAKTALNSEDGLRIFYASRDYPEEVRLQYDVYVGESAQRGMMFNERPEDFVKIGEGAVTGKELNDGALEVVYKNVEDYERPLIITTLKSGEKVINRIMNYLEPWDGAGILAGEVRSKEARTELYMQLGVQSYLAMNGSTLEMRYTGVNFDENEEYTISNPYTYATICKEEKPSEWTSWSRNEKNEYCNGDYADSVIEPFKISGKDLNDGKLVIEIPYAGLPDEVESVSLAIAVDGPNEGETFHGTSVYVRYVDANEILSSGRGYKINNTSARIAGISERTSIASFAGDIDVNGDGKIVVLKDGEEVDPTKNVGTNMTVRVVDEYDRAMMDVTAVVSGDLTGNGEIGSADLLKMRHQLIGDMEMEGAYLEAANVSKDDENVDSKDLLMMRSHLIGNYEIK